MDSLREKENIHQDKMPKDILMTGKRVSISAACFWLRNCLKENDESRVLLYASRYLLTTKCILQADCDEEFDAYGFIADMLSQMAL